MSKELLKPSQFSRAESSWNDEPLILNAEQMKELSDLYEGSAQQFRQGKIIHGTVLKAGPDGVLVDIQYKSNGHIPAYEFTEAELKKLIPGTDIEVILDELENAAGNVILSYEKAKALKAWDFLVKLYEEGKPVEGIVKINQKRGNVIISRRKFLHEIRSEGRKKVLDLLDVNQIIQGVVKNITNYGVFVDIGGVDGLLHITDMTWGRISHPSEVLEMNQKLNVVV